jgi:hypothetical protein
MQLAIRSVAYTAGRTRKESRAGVDAGYRKEQLSNGS